MKPGLYPLLGPPASGKTTLAREWALEVLNRRGRVYWVGLPHQRAYVYRLFGGEEAVLGLEFMSFQALYYRVLAEVGRLGPLLPGAGRVALVGEALRSLYGEGVAPGEARLFARAIAELKRYGLSPFALPKEGEAGRLRRVYLAYERLKGKALDYDDFRHRAGRVPLRLFPRPDLVVVDGFREVGPLDLRFLKRLAQEVPVLLTLELLPEDLKPWRVLSSRPVRKQVLALANPVEESRYLLRALKRALVPREMGGEGLDPWEVLVVAPEERIGGLLLLKDEYGLPLFDGRERALADTEEGERVLALLNPYPTGRDLLVLGFSRLGRKALRLGLAGEEALEALAEREGLGEEWRAFQELRTPGPDVLAWAEGALEHLGVSLKEPFLSRLRLALRADRGNPLAWWRSLLLDESLSPEPNRGVSLLPPLRAMGVRARRAYVLEWVAGRYSLKEGEDYFLLEELRERGLLKGLVRRLRGLDPLFREEVSTRGEEVFLLYPEAGPSGLHLPLERGDRPEALPPASRLEALPHNSFAPPLPSGQEPPPHLEVLRRFRECPFRAYVERFGLKVRDGALGWHLLPAELERLLAHPEVGLWLEAHRAHWEGMRFWFSLPGKPPLRLDGVRREGNVVHLYRLLPQDGEPDLDPQKRWTEWYALGVLVNRKDVAEVRLWIWPWMGRPSLQYRQSSDKELPKAVGEVRKRAREAYQLWRQGAFPPKPGPYCHTCGLEDLCRKEEL
ncbi:PD-(D/E)XK nuclease family protein [Thermus antranikianii]|uniref:PD-(D/E)XK endonuclease-like domain-containing protein n=1 Tax=Thermus antranikianii TaxID=88190 RepID=A0ABY7RMU6_9DEIN|nr:hypothetical protein [Thermus antranikianii]QWK22307.1 MAG: hypothetical protein KNN15_02180 [Thermus antranikianii]WCM39037.1 hypothetical protein GO600_02320 [Thermus antranikianii]